ncbi:MAG: hypothetical protein HN337_00830 [Deltaproteobacteria bacterium]|nr:hypothetical protein [Deltaproteobacteria bacterium]
MGTLTVPYRAFIPPSGPFVRSPSQISFSSFAPNLLFAVDQGLRSACRRFSSGAQNIYNSIAIRTGDVTTAMGPVGVENTAMLGSFVMAGAVATALGGSGAASLSAVVPGLGFGGTEDEGYSLFIESLPEWVSQKIKSLGDVAERPLYAMYKNVGGANLREVLIRLMIMGTTYNGVVESFFVSMEKLRQRQIEGNIYQMMREFSKYGEVFGLVHQVMRTADFIDFGIPVTDVERTFAAVSSREMNYKFWLIHDGGKILRRARELGIQRVEADCYSRSTRTVFEIKSAFHGFKGEAVDLLMKLHTSNDWMIDTSGVKEETLNVMVRLYNQISRLGAAVKVGIFDSVELHLTSPSRIPQRVVDLIHALVPNAKVYRYGGIFRKRNEAVELKDSSQFEWVREDDGGVKYKRIGVGSWNHSANGVGGGSSYDSFSDELGFQLQELLGAGKKVNGSLRKRVRRGLYSLVERLNQASKDLEALSMPGDLASFPDIALDIADAVSDSIKPPAEIGDRVEYVKKLHMLYQMTVAMESALVALSTMADLFLEYSTGISDDDVVSTHIYDAVVPIAQHMRRIVESEDISIHMISELSYFIDITNRMLTETLSKGAYPGEHPPRTIWAVLNRQDGVLD